MPSQTELIQRIHLLERENDALQRDKEAMLGVMEQWSEAEGIQKSEIRPNGTPEAGTGVTMWSLNQSTPPFLRQRHAFAFQEAISSDPSPLVWF